MASLLGLSFGGQRQSYFQVRITIHELANVPMVAGEFKAKWRVEHSQNLASAIAAVQSGASSGLGYAQHNNEGSSSGTALHHKKSTSTLNSQSAGLHAERDEDGSVDSGSLRRTNKDRDDASSTYSGKRSRKSGHRFLSGLREAFHGANPPKQDSNAALVGRDSKRPSVDLGAPSRRAANASAASTEDGNEYQEHHEHHKEGAAAHEPHHPRESSGHHTTNLLNFEPRGETSSARVKDSRVVWERHVDVGVRMGIEKPRQVSGGSQHHGQGLADGASQQQGGSGAGSSASSAYGARSSDTTMRRSISARDVHGLDVDRRDQHPSGSSTPRDPDNARWGLLGQSELRISVKADVPTGTETHHAGHHTSMRLGHVTVNLADFAPYPHHHHHHHHNHHRISSGAHPQHSDGQHHQHHHHPLTRTETRRYLLFDSPTNATIKLTVEMTHVGGSKEYSVPANKRGLLVGASATAIAESAPINTGHNGPTSSAGSDAGSAAEAGSGSGDHHDAQGRSQQQKPTSQSNTAKALAEWHPHSVARHTRIPAANLNTTLTHKDTARAIKEAGVGGRLAFSFAAGAHHDRPPEDVIDGLFDSAVGHQTDTTLTPTPSRDRPRDAAAEESAPHERDRQQTKRGSMGTSNISKARDTAHSKTGKESTSTSPSKRGDKPLNRSSSGKGVKSCLMHGACNILSHNHHHHHHHHHHHQSQPQSSAQDTARPPKQRGNSTATTDSSRASVTGSAVHWDDSVADASSYGERRRGSIHGSEGSSTNAESSTKQAPLSASPKLLSSSSLPEYNEGGSVEDDDMRPSTDESLPPKTPPDVARREAILAVQKDGFTLAPPVTIAPPWATKARRDSGKGDVQPTSQHQQEPGMLKKPSRRTLGLSREAALNAGYRGAGWGTLDMSRHASHTSMDSSADESINSDSDHGPTFAYLVERTNSPSPLHRTAAH